jgi:nicotinamide-nucleotide amidase
VNGTPASVAVATAIARKVTLATAESLTAGMVAAELATVPGASGTLRGGVVSYQSRIKTAVLGVDAGLLEREGAVTEAVACQMADGARRVLQADIAVSTTGVAGPEPHGGRDVGTVWIGVASPDGTRAVEYRFEGDRARIRRLACEAAIEQLGRAIDAAGGPAGNGDSGPGTKTLIQ